MDKERNNVEMITEEERKKIVKEGMKGRKE